MAHVTGPMAHVTEPMATARGPRRRAQVADLHGRRICQTSHGDATRRHRTLRDCAGHHTTASRHTARTSAALFRWRWRPSQEHGQTHHQVGLLPSRRRRADRGALVRSCPPLDATCLPACRSGEGLDAERPREADRVRGGTRGRRQSQRKRETRRGGMASRRSCFRRRHHARGGMKGTNPPAPPEFSNVRPQPRASVSHAPECSCPLPEPRRCLEGT